MKRLTLITALTAMVLTSCGNPTQKASEADFVDAVSVALAADGKVDLNALEWTREPGGCKMDGNTIAITTAPHTDLWQRTYYHFRNDNAPVLQMKTREQYFSFVVNGFYPKPPALRPVRHCDVSGQRQLAQRLRGIRERGVPASGQRSHQQRLF